MSGICDRPLRASDAFSARQQLASELARRNGQFKAYRGVSYVGNPLNLLLVIVYVRHDCFPSSRCSGRGLFISTRSLLGDCTRLRARKGFPLIERRSLVLKCRFQLGASSAHATSPTGVYLHFFNFHISCIRNGQPGLLISPEHLRPAGGAQAL